MGGNQIFTQSVRWNSDDQQKKKKNSPPDRLGKILGGSEAQWYIFLRAGREEGQRHSGSGVFLVLESRC